MRYRNAEHPCWGNPSRWRIVRMVALSVTAPLLCRLRLCTWEDRGTCSECGRPRRHRSPALRRVRRLLGTPAVQSTSDLPPE